MDARGHGDVGFGFIRAGQNLDAPGTGRSDIVEWDGAFGLSGGTGQDSDATVGTSILASDAWWMIAVEIGDAADGGGGAKHQRVYRLAARTSREGLNP